MSFHSSLSIMVVAFRCGAAALLWFLFLAPPLLPVVTLADEVADALCPATRGEHHDVPAAGVFGGGDDEVVRVVPFEEENRWVVAVQELSGSSTVYLADKEEGRLRPSRFSAQGFFAGHPIRVSGDGDRIYGFIDSKDRPIGFRYDMASREMITSIKGIPVSSQPSTSGEIALSILASDMAHTWQSIRSGFMSVRDNALVSDESEARLFARPGRMAYPSRATTYGRLGEWGDADSAVMDQAMNLIRTTDASARSLDRAIQEAREAPAEPPALEGR